MHYVWWAAIEEHAEQSAKAQARMEASLQEQERLRREAAQIKREKIAKDLYVTDVEGKLSSRESSLSDSQKELNVLKNSVREMEEENRKITARFQEADQELKQTRLARGALASRIEALSLSHTDEEAR
jgi:serine phosphatase RsbU (regulator of sigma subunit)